MSIFNRHSTNLSIATLWEFYQYKKFNFDPEYQRSAEVWNEDKQSFLIDSIIKNFPLPPIFLHEHIDSVTGNTKYDVIDGKQRLQSIFKFIQNELSIPEDCSSDGFIVDEADGKKFSELSTPELVNIKRSFWSYQITIEFIDSEDKQIIDNIFDRLNRNGEPLNPQELRNAKFHSNDNYKKIVSLPSNSNIQPYLSRLDKNRKEDIEFCSELLFTILEGNVIDSNRTQLDGFYEKYCKDNYYVDKVKQAAITYNSVLERFSIIVKDFSRYYVYSVSHLYAIWCLAWQCFVQEITPDTLATKLPEFYDSIKAKDTNTNIQQYIESMKQATKSSSSRKMRVNAMLAYMGMKGI